MPRIVDCSEYLACLPVEWRLQAASVPPTDSIWWTWRSIRLHIRTLPRTDARARLLLLHGAGGHSGALWPLGSLAANLGYEVLAPDLPGYGLTEVPDPASVIYPDWIDCIADLVRVLTATDKRPLVILGASMGGMLGYSVSARVPGAIAHLLSTCFLDPSNPVCWPALSRWGGAPSVRLLRPLLAVAARHRWATRLQIPIRWVAPMSSIANQPHLTNLCTQDARGGGGKVPVGFLASFLFSTPEIQPEEFHQVPVTLIHPVNDRWTPPSMSLAFLHRIAGPTRHVPLEGCGHFPVEEPGLTRAVHVLQQVIEQVTPVNTGAGITAPSIR